jgi:ferritin
MKYIQIYSHFEDLQLLNLAKKFKGQADEELDHSQQLIDYLNERFGGKVSVSEIPASDLQLLTLQDVANAYMEIELLTTEMIQEIMETVEREKSYIDRKFVEEFLHQQIKEEDEADEFMKKAILVKDILLFDATLGG